MPSSSLSSLTLSVIQNLFLVPPGSSRRVGGWGGVTPDDNHVLRNQGSIPYLPLSQRLGTSDFSPNYPHLLSLLVPGTPPPFPCLGFLLCLESLSSAPAPYLSAPGDLCTETELVFFRMLRGRSSQGLSWRMQVDSDSGMFAELYTPDPPDPGLNVPDTLVPGKGGINPSGCVPAPKLWPATSPGCWLNTEPRTAVPPEGWLESGLRIMAPPLCVGGPEP